MVRKLVVLLTIVALVGLGAAVVRASAWTPVAPTPLPASGWAPIVDPEPARWQTLDNVSFEAGGGTFVAELQGFPALSSGAVHSFVVRVVRTGGDAAPVWVGSGSLDGNPMDRADVSRGAIEARFPFFLTGPASIAAELEVRAWRPVAWGYVEESPVQLVLRAQIERQDPAA